MAESYFFMISAVALASISQLLLKFSAKKHYKSWLYEYLNVHVIVAYIILLSSTVLTILAFKNLDYKNAPVIESIGYVFILILSHLFLREKITKKQLLGNFVIIIGILVFYL